VLRLKRPDKEAIDRFLAERAQAPYTYSEVSATRSESRVRGLVDRYRVQRLRVRLGTGAESFAAAADALWAGAIFPSPMVELHPAGASLEVGSVVGVLAHTGPLWSLHPSRVIYTLREERRVGFAYGTLPGHAFRGEERFVVEWTAPDEDVIFELLSFSRAATWWSRIATPYARRLQRRFGDLSCASMIAAAQLPESLQG
jgi:uncharacterized protein (UPF0548 family)